MTFNSHPSANNGHITSTTARDKTTLSKQEERIDGRERSKGVVHGHVGRVGSDLVLLAQGLNLPDESTGTEG